VKVSFLIGNASIGKLPMFLAWVILCFFSIVTHQAQAQSRELRTVVSEGFGRDIADASQQAARSALTNVVGSFVDAETMIKKRTEIENAVRSQTVKIDRNVREYSQGVIQSFEILAVSESSGLTKVTAKVTVRVEDFRVYIKEMASGSTSVDSGLFAQMQIEAKQSNNAAKILHDNFLQPLTKGEGLQIQVGPPVPFSQTPFSKDRYIVQSPFAEKIGLSSIVGFELSITLNSNFWINIERSLRSISSSSGNLQGSQSGNLNLPNQLREEDSVTVLIREPIEHTMDRFKTFEELTTAARRLEANFVYYKVDKVRSELRKLSTLGTYFAGFDGRNRPDIRSFVPKLTIEVTDQSGSIIKTFKIDSSKKSIGDIMLPTLQIYNDNISGTVPWGVTVEANHNVVGFRDRRFWVLLGVDTETLRRASKIAAKLTSE